VGGVKHDKLRPVSKESLDRIAGKKRKRKFGFSRGTGNRNLEPGEGRTSEFDNRGVGSHRKLHWKRLVGEERGEKKGRKLGKTPVVAWALKT